MNVSDFDPKTIFEKRTGRVAIPICPVFSIVTVVEPEMVLRYSRELSTGTTRSRAVSPVMIWVGDRMREQSASKSTCCARRIRSAIRVGVAGEVTTRARYSAPKCNLCRSDGKATEISGYSLSGEETMNAGAISLGDRR